MPRQSEHCWWFCQGKIRTGTNTRSKGSAEQRNLLTGYDRVSRDQSRMTGQTSSDPLKKQVPFTLHQVKRWNLGTSLWHWIASLRRLRFWNRLKVKPYYFRQREIPFRLKRLTLILSRQLRSGPIRAPHRQTIPLPSKNRQAVIISMSLSISSQFTLSSIKFASLWKMAKLESIQLHETSPSAEKWVVGEIVQEGKKRWRASFRPPLADRSYPSAFLHWNYRHPPPSHFFLLLHSSLLENMSWIVLTSCIRFGINECSRMHACMHACIRIGSMAPMVANWLMGSATREERGYNFIPTP